MVRVEYRPVSDSYLLTLDNGHKIPISAKVLQIAREDGEFVVDTRYVNGEFRAMNMQGCNPVSIGPSGGKFLTIEEGEFVVRDTPPCDPVETPYLHVFSDSMGLRRFVSNAEAQDIVIVHKF